MTSVIPNQSLNAPNDEGTPQVWMNVRDAENGELYAFVEDLTFSHPAKSLQVLEKMLAHYQEFLEKLGINAVMKTQNLTALPDALVIHLTDEKNFVLEAMAHIRGILQGEAFYRPFMNATFPANCYGERFISVRVEGVIVANGPGADLMFNVKLLAVEANPRTGKFTIVQVIEKDNAESNPLTTLVQPTQGGTISTTLGDQRDEPPLNADISFLPTEPVSGTTSND